MSTSIDLSSLSLTEVSDSPEDELRLAQDAVKEARNHEAAAKAALNAAHRRVRRAKGAILEAKYGVPGFVRLLAPNGKPTKAEANLVATCGDGSALYMREDWGRGNASRKFYFLRTADGEVARHDKGYRKSGPAPAPVGRYSWIEEAK